MKTNLPVIILKVIVLLPNNDIRLEFENDDSKNIVDISELFHDNKVLVVSQLDLLEEMPNTVLIDGSIGVSKEVKRQLEEHGLLNDERVRKIEIYNSLTEKLETIVE